MNFDVSLLDDGVVDVIVDVRVAPFDTAAAVVVAIDVACPEIDRRSTDPIVAFCSISTTFSTARRTFATISFTCKSSPVTAVCKMPIKITKTLNHNIKHVMQ